MGFNHNVAEDSPVLLNNITGFRRGISAFMRLIEIAVWPTAYRTLYNREQDPWSDEDTIIQVLEEARNVWKPLEPIHDTIPAPPDEQDDDET